MYIVTKTFINANGKSTISIIGFTDCMACNSFMRDQKKLFCDEIVSSGIEFDNDVVIIKNITAVFADGTEEYMEVDHICNGDQIVIYEE